MTNKSTNQYIEKNKQSTKRKENLDKILKIFSACTLFSIGIFLLFSQIVRFFNTNEYKNNYTIFESVVVSDSKSGKCIKILKPQNPNNFKIMVDQCKNNLKLNDGENINVKVLNKDLENKDNYLLGKLEFELQNNQFLNSDLILPFFLITTGLFWSYREISNKQV